MSETENNTPAAPKKQTGRLTRPEAFKAAAWCHQNMDRIKGMTRAQVAVVMSHDLALNASPDTVSKLFTDMGIEFPGIRKPPTAGKHKAYQRLIAGASLKILAVIDRLMKMDSIGGLIGPAQVKQIQDILSTVNIQALAAISRNREHVEQGQ